MKIMIGCSSRSEVDQKYLDLAKSISKKCNSLGYELVFGAASSGMMGRCYSSFDTVYSYTIDKYVEDLKNIPSKEQFVLDTSFDRTKQMFLDSDYIVILPGGTGTLGELFSILEENRSIANPKCYILYNYDGYYDGVLNMIDTCVQNHFNDSSIYDYFQVVSNEEELFQKIKSVR